MKSLLAGEIKQLDAFRKQNRAERDARSCRAEADLTQLCFHVARKLWAAPPQEYHFLFRP